jgi:polyisoprenoid-binding protein YceI
MSIVKKLLLGALAAVVLVVGATVVYVQFIKGDAPAKLDFIATDSPTTTSGSSVGTGATESTTTVPVGPGVDGTWTVSSGTQVGYRVKEDFIGGLQNSDAVGRTSSVTGSVTLSRTSATAASFTADMRTLKSDDSRRDGQVQGRILSTSQFPEAKFVLTAPIDFGRIPSGANDVVTASATGDLTLRGVTKRVTFEVQSILDNGAVQVKGQIPVVFADYGIPSPSNAIVSVRDNGTLEFLLVLRR